MSLVCIVLKERIAFVVPGFRGLFSCTTEINNCWPESVLRIGVVIRAYLCGEWRLIFALNLGEAV